VVVKQVSLSDVQQVSISDIVAATCKAMLCELLTEHEIAHSVAHRVATISNIQSELFHQA